MLCICFSVRSAKEARSPEEKLEEASVVPEIRSASCHCAAVFYRRLWRDRRLEPVGRVLYASLRQLQGRFLLAGLCAAGADSGGHGVL